MSYLGIDVSEFNGNIDYKKVKQAGYNFVIVRCGYDEYYQDPYWKQNVNSAHNNGLHVGAYWFMYFTSEKEAIEHADIFIQYLSEFKGKIDYPVALDVEEDTYRYMKQVGVKPTKSIITKLINIFCKRVEQAGYYIMVYSNLNGFNNYIGDVSDFDIWLAQYDGHTPYKTCGICQHTSRGKVSGIYGDVDLDIAYKDYPTILRNNRLNHLTNNSNVIINKIKVGDKVKIVNPIVYNTNKKFAKYYDVYDVIEVTGDRVVIGINGVVTAPINIDNIIKV